MIRNIFLLIMLILCGSLSESAEAQTCRVRQGVTSGGACSYKEVYEYDYVTDKPFFPGGETELLAYVNETRRYPAQAYRRGVEGRVVCSFVINCDGSVSHVKVVKGVEESLNAEAMRILSSMPNWKPGKINGVTVPVRLVYPVAFRK